MEDEQVIPEPELISNPEETLPIKVKKWEHIAVRPETFMEFREAKGERFKSDDAFVKSLLRNKPQEVTNAESI